MIVLPVDLRQSAHPALQENHHQIPQPYLRKGVMMQQRSMLCLLALALCSAGAGAQIAAPPTEQTAASVKREIIPGSELMTSQERERYRQRIRAAKSPAEEDQVRGDHTAQIRERARVRGLQLREPEPPKQSGGKP